MANQKTINMEETNQFNKHSLSTIAEEPKSQNTTQERLDKQEMELAKPTRPLLVYHPPPKKVFSPCAFRKQFKSAKIPGCSERLGIPHDQITRDSMVDPLLHHIKTDKKPLFETVVSDGSSKEPSILITGFGLRNLASLQNALGIEEQKRLKELYKAQERVDEYEQSSISSESLIVTKTDLTSATQTEISSMSSKEIIQKKKIMFLLGMQDMDEEEEGEGEGMSAEFQKYEEREEVVVLSEAMRQAQKYLRAHQIFKFFQFITAHLLSALPDNPIQFIIDLLNECLVFRSGFSEAPLLYTRKHLECLFYLMDKMRTGYIELKQYNTGMHTLGICEYNEEPNLNLDNMVSKEDFINEAYNRLTDQMNELVRRRWLNGVPPVTPPPPPSLQTTISSATTGELECTGENIPVASNSNLHFTKTKMFLDCDL